MKQWKPGSPVLFFLAMAAILAIGWGNDHASCQRQVPIRKESLVRERVLKDFLLTAAATRQASASHEHGYQRVLDLKAAKRWRLDATQIHTLPIPSCDGLFPSTN